MSSVLWNLDNFLQGWFGIPYLRVSRDGTIHDRCRYLVKVIRDLNLPPLSVLDVGCGAAMPLRYLDRFAHSDVRSYTGIDMNTARLGRRYRHIQLPHQFHDVLLDDDWNFGEFDLVWCSEVLEHLVDDVGVFRKLCRSVKPGGHVVVTMPSLEYLVLMGKEIPSVLVISATQDGGHVRLGYTHEGLGSLGKHANVTLLRCDAVTRTDLAYERRLRCWPPKLHFINHFLDATTRSKNDCFATAHNEPITYSEWMSIAGIYQRA